MVEPPVSYLESTVPAAACEMAIVFGSAGYALFCLSCPIYLNTVSLLRYFLRPTIAMIRKKITGDELSARAKENGYQRDVYRVSGAEGSAGNRILYRMRGDAYRKAYSMLGACIMMTLALQHTETERWRRGISLPAPAPMGLYWR